MMSPDSAIQGSTSRRRTTPRGEVTGSRLSPRDAGEHPSAEGIPDCFGVNNEGTVDSWSELLAWRLIVHCPRLCDPGENRERLGGRQAPTRGRDPRAPEGHPGASMARNRLAAKDGDWFGVPRPLVWGVAIATTRRGTAWS